jgi:hypothetical protein
MQQEVRPVCRSFQSFVISNSPLLLEFLVLERLLPCSLPGFPHVRRDNILWGNSKTPLKLELSVVLYWIPLLLSLLSSNWDGLKLARWKCREMGMWVFKYNWIRRSDYYPVVTEWMSLNYRNFFVPEIKIALPLLCYRLRELAAPHRRKSCVNLSKFSFPFLEYPKPKCTQNSVDLTLDTAAPIK